MSFFSISLSSCFFLIQLFRYFNLHWPIVNKQPCRHIAKCGQGFVKPKINHVNSGNSNSYRFWVWCRGSWRMSCSRYSVHMRPGNLRWHWMYKLRSFSMTTQIVLHHGICHLQKLSCHLLCLHWSFHRDPWSKKN